MITTVETVYILDDTLAAEVEIDFDFEEVAFGFAHGSVEGTHVEGYWPVLLDTRVVELVTTDEAELSVAIEPSMLEEIKQAIDELDLEALAVSCQTC